MFHTADNILTEFLSQNFSTELFQRDSLLRCKFLGYDCLLHVTNTKTNLQNWSQAQYIPKNAFLLMSPESCGMRAADRFEERILVMRVMCVLCRTFMELNLKPFMDVYFNLRDALSLKQMAYCLLFKHDLQVEVYCFL